MSKNQTMQQQMEDWLTNDQIAALVCQEYLQSVEGPDEPVFPPTYPLGKEKSGYNIDRFADGHNVCQLDSVGSQANRLEPIFKQESYRNLVPQVTVQAGERTIHLLDAGHRAADAVIRFSELQTELQSAFLAWRDNGDAMPLAKLAPTSLVFGAWDSRDTGAKIPRVVTSVIRAYDVHELTRSAVYTPPLSYVNEGLLDEPADKKGQEHMSELGFSHAPATGTPGGVIAREIRRNATLSLAALRTLGAEDEVSTRQLRQYILGLALTALTCPVVHNLRQGCLLVAAPNRTAQWELVYCDGKREIIDLSHGEILEVTKLLAQAFGVEAGREVAFLADQAQEELGISKKERKKKGKKAKSSKDKEQQDDKE